MLKVIEAKKEDRDTVMNLLEKYLYEFSQWEKTDVNDKGLYGYEYLDCYFEEKTAGAEYASWKMAVKKTSA